jgi:hypothetical protein
MPVETQCLRLTDAKYNAQNHSLKSILLCQNTVFQTNNLTLHNQLIINPKDFRTESFGFFLKLKLCLSLINLFKKVIV